MASGCRVLGHSGQAQTAAWMSGLKSALYALAAALAGLGNKTIICTSLHGRYPWLTAQTRRFSLLSFFFYFFFFYFFFFFFFFFFFSSSSSSLPLSLSPHLHLPSLPIFISPLSSRYIYLSLSRSLHLPVLLEKRHGVCVGGKWAYW